MDIHEHEIIECMTCCNKKICKQWDGSWNPAMPTPCILYNVHCTVVGELEEFPTS